MPGLNSDCFYGAQKTQNAQRVNFKIRQGTGYY